MKKRKPRKNKVRTTKKAAKRKAPETYEYAKAILQGGYGNSRLG